MFSFLGSSNNNKHTLKGNCEKLGNFLNFTYQKKYSQNFRENQLFFRKVHFYHNFWKSAFLSKFFLEKCIFIKIIFGKAFLACFGLDWKNHSTTGNSQVKCCQKRFNFSFTQTFRQMTSKKHATFNNSCLPQQRWRNNCGKKKGLFIRLLDLFESKPNKFNFSFVVLTKTLLLKKKRKLLRWTCLKATNKCNFSFVVKKKGTSICCLLMFVVVFGFLTSQWTNKTKNWRKQLLCPKLASVEQDKIRKEQKT